MKCSFLSWKTSSKTCLGRFVAVDTFQRTVLETANALVNWVLFSFNFYSKREFPSLILLRPLLPLNSAPIWYSILSYFIGIFYSLTRVGHSCMETFIAKSGLKCHCAFTFISCLYMIIILLTVTQHWALEIYVQQFTVVGQRFGLFPLLPNNCSFTEIEREKILTPGTEEKTNRALLIFTVTTSFSTGNISAIRVKSKAH